MSELATHPDGEGNEEGGSGRNWFYWAAVVVGTCALLYFASRSFLSGRYSVLIQELGITLGFLLLSPLAWWLGDVFRRYAKPNWYLSTGSVDAAKKRFFWTYGPQLYAVGALAAVAIFACMVLEDSAVQSAGKLSGEVSAHGQAERRRQKNSPSPNEAVPVETVRAAESAQRVDPVVDQAAPPVRGSRAEAAFTPSFDCTRASSVPERLICGNKELAELDVEVSDLYFRARRIALDRDSLQEVQFRWLTYGRDVCEDADCLRDAYESRIRELSEEVNDNPDD